MKTILHFLTLCWLGLYKYFRPIIIAISIFFGVYFSFKVINWIYGYRERDNEKETRQINNSIRFGSDVALKIVFKNKDKDSAEIVKLVNDSLTKIYYHGYYK